MGNAKRCLFWRAVSSLPLSIMCLIAFPTKQDIIYVSSMALFRLSARMEMYNFHWAEIISSALSPLLSLFSKVSMLTFCHRIVRWCFLQREDMYKGKSDGKLPCTSDSHPEDFRWQECSHSFGWERSCWCALHCHSDGAGALCSLSKKATIWKLLSCLSHSQLFLNCLFWAIGAPENAKRLLYFKLMKDLKVYLSTKAIIWCQILVGC